MSVLPPQDVLAAFAPVLQAIESHAFSLAKTVDLVGIRPGYRNNDGATPAIVLAFRPPQPAHAETVGRELATRAGVAVWMTEASPEEQLRWLAADQRPQRDPALERWFAGEDEPPGFPIIGSYEAPANAPKLDPVEAVMRVTLAASPDAGWPVLNEFLSRAVNRKLVIGLYHFTAPHIYRALRKAMLADPDSELRMVRHPDLGDGGSGIKADDIDGETIVKRLRKALGDRFDFAKTTVGKSGVFGTSYHIKVAVADSRRFWLSSGNWQSSNQPPYDPIHAPDDLPASYQRRYNREYHAIIDHAGLAKTFEKYIEHDLAAAHEAPPPSFELPDVAVALDEDVPEFAPPRWFEPLRLHRKIKVQPVLTPDNYSKVVLALIERAKTSVWFQNQYISLLADNNFTDFSNLVKALLAKQKAGLDVRIICRDQMEAKKIDVLIGAGFDPELLRFQTGCHNKTIIVDGKEVLIGSHNWSNDGTVSNRDASLLFFDDEIAAYFAEIYDYDWSRARPRAQRKQPRVLRDGEVPPFGTERTPFGDLFEDGSRSFGAPASVKPDKPKPKPDIPEFDVAEEAIELFPSGVREDGTLLTTKISVKDLAAFIRGEPAATPPPSVVAAAARVGLESMGLPFGVTPDNLSKAGWGVVFSDDVPQTTRDKLKPLLEHRKQQANVRYKELTYKAGESVRDWLTRHNVAFGTITPSRVPYHLMLVGSPKSLPFEFQYLLDLEYSVGRLWFDDEALFANYATSVVNYEKAPQPVTKKEMLYFGPSRGGDAATQLSATHLVTPLVEGTVEDSAIATECGFGATSLIGNQAKKDAIVKALHDGGKRLAMLFTASHGLSCISGAQTQRQRQGALVTADWTGGAIDGKSLLAAADITDDATIHGLVAFVFACYGAGTPTVDNFPRDVNAAAAPVTIAPEPFVAALPQRLLGHPKGGALAVIGHIERAWAYSIQPPKVDPQILPFRNAIGRILNGEPVGEATRDLSERHATLSTEMVGLLAPSAPPVDDFTLVKRWLEKNDARNYVVLGDPAVRIRSTDI